MDGLGRTGRVGLIRAAGPVWRGMARPLPPAPPTVYVGTRCRVCVWSASKRSTPAVCVVFQPQFQVVSQTALLACNTFSGVLCLASGLCHLLSLVTQGRGKMIYSPSLDHFSVTGYGEVSATSPAGEYKRPLLPR